MIILHFVFIVNSTAEEVELRGEFWRSRMQLLQGAILVACLVEVSDVTRENALFMSHLIEVNLI